MYHSAFHMDSMTIHNFSAPGPHYFELQPSSHPILTPGYEIRPSLVAMVRSQSFSGCKDENTYTHLHEFEQNYSIISIPGKHHETVKWKLFPSSLMGRANEWYSLTVWMVEGNWNVLKEKFCFNFFPLHKIVYLRIEALFQATRGRISRSSMGSLYRANFYRTRLEYTQGYEPTALCLWP